MDRIVQPNSRAAIISRPNTADNDSENDQARHDMVYTYGDPNQWTPFLSCFTGSGTVDDPHKFEMRITERDFIAEQSNYEGLRTVALEALKILDDESNFIVEDASGDAVLDDNGNKMLFMRILVREVEPWEPWVFYLKKIVHGQETILTEREKKRLRFYFAEAYDGSDEVGGQSGKGEGDEQDDNEEGEDEKRDVRMGDSNISS